MAACSHLAAALRGPAGARGWAHLALQALLQPAGAWAYTCTRPGYWAGRLACTPNVEVPRLSGRVQARTIAEAGAGRSAPLSALSMLLMEQTRAQAVTQVHIRIAHMQVCAVNALGEVKGGSRA